MSKSRSSQRRLPPLLSVSPVAQNYATSRSTSPSPIASSSKYHSNCCLPTRSSSPGPGGYLEVISRKISRSTRSPRMTRRNTRPQSQGFSQKVTDYLRKHEDFLEQYVLDNISLDLLERWIIRKTQRQRKRTEGFSETNDKIPNLSRWKFCVHADKREMLQELTSTLFSYPNKIHVLSELANTVGSAVNATGWRLHIYDAETQELSTLGSNEDSNSIPFEGTIAEYVLKTKKSIRYKSNEKDNELPGLPSIHLSNPVNIMCHPVYQPDGELSGVLELYKDTSDTEFHEEDEEIVNSYLVWGGIALHYAELYVAMMKQRELNLFLLTVVKSIFQDMISMDSVILKIMMFARKLVSADRASLFLVDGRTSELYARIFDISSSDIDVEDPNVRKECDVRPQEIRFPIGKGIAGFVAMTGESLNIPDAYNDERFNRSVDQRTGYSTKNLLCMPIFIRGSVIGVVQMVNKSSGAFTKNDEESFAVFAIYCGLALHHAKLYDKIRRSEQKHKLALEILSYHNTCSEEEISSIQSINLAPSSEEFMDFNFSPERLSSDEKVVASMFMLKDLPNLANFVNIATDSLTRFTLTVRKNYRRVPYHNWTHGFSVANSMYAVLRSSGVFKPLEDSYVPGTMNADVYLDVLDNSALPTLWQYYGDDGCFFQQDRAPFYTTKPELDWYPENEELALYVACLCHDLDHRGKTNQFLVKAASPLAAIYSTSVLEHHHFNMTVSILQQDGHNIFSNLSSEDYKKVLNNIKHCILATDLTLYFPNKAKLTKIVKDNEFDWKLTEHRHLLQAITMTACDLCGSTKSWEQQKEIVKVIFEEFYDQGDVEKLQGIQPISIMDRSKIHEQPDSQVGFLKGICIPCYELLYSLIPGTKPMLDGCRANLEKWESLVENRTKENEQLETTEESARNQETDSSNT